MFCEYHLWRTLQRVYNPKQASNEVKWKCCLHLSPEKNKHTYNLVTWGKQKLKHFQHFLLVHKFLFTFSHKNKTQKPIRDFPTDIWFIIMKNDSPSEFWVPDWGCYSETGSLFCMGLGQPDIERDLVGSKAAHGRCLYLDDWGPFQCKPFYVSVFLRCTTLQQWSSGS